MNNIVFVDPRHYYNSYKELSRLIHLSGFKRCYTDEVNISSDCVYVFYLVNGELWHNGPTGPLSQIGTQRKRAKLVLWRLENGSSRSTYPEDIDSYFDEFWYPDRACVKHVGCREKVRFVPIGGHTGMGFVSPTEMQYDLIHLSYVTHRRSMVYSALEKSHGASIAPNDPGDFVVSNEQAWSNRAALLNRVKFMLDIRQEDHAPYIAPLRYNIAAACGLPVITERPEDPFPFELGKHIIPVEYSRIVSQVLEMLPQHEHYRHVGHELHRLLCVDMTFRRCIEEAALQIR